MTLLTRRLGIIFFIALLLLPGIAGAAQADTTFRPGQLVAPGALLLTGTGIHCFSHDPGLDRSVQQFFSDAAHGPVSIDEWLQYAPLAMDIGLGFAGVKAEKGFVDRVIEAGWASVSVAAVSLALKYAVASVRPDGEAYSFPSGHAAKAFVGAELMRIEYGNAWGAGAYAMAGTVGVLRLYNDRHWLSDVLVGAGIGILCAHIGEWLTGPTRDLLGPGPDGRYALSPCVDPVSGTLCASFALQF